MSVVHWQDATGKWWHEIYQGGKGHPADPAHKFEYVDMPCACDPPPTKDDRIAAPPSPNKGEAP